MSGTVAEVSANGSPQSEKESKQTIEASPRRVVQSGREAMALLAEAYEYAQQLGRSTWDFAVEIAELRRAGLTNSGLRWLVCKGYLELACEFVPRGGEVRQFVRRNGLTFCKRMCFVLTDAGARFVHTNLGQTSAGNNAPKLDCLSANSPPLISESEVAVLESVLPKWDRDRQELRLGKYIVKQFKVPAANQEMILAAFQEEGWPVRVDDPLPPRADQDPKRRLHDTINSLNRSQKHPVVRFLGDGSGEGVRWERNLPQPPPADADDFQGR